MVVERVIIRERVVKPRKSNKILLKGAERRKLKELRKVNRVQKQVAEIPKLEETIRRRRRYIADERFKRTRTARLGRFVRRIPGQVGQGRLRVGRPRGSFDSRYAKYGGVYGFRKLQSAALRQQRFQQMRENTLTPEQQQLLAQAAARQQARRLDPEQQIIPDTNGRFDLRKIMQEIEEASNIAG